MSQTRVAALAAWILSLVLAHAAGAGPNPYIPVFGGPTYSPNTGGYVDGGVGTMSVNNAGTAVGAANKYDGPLHNLGPGAVRWDGSGAPAIELDKLGMDADGFANDSASAINDAGTAVGAPINMTRRKFSWRSRCYFGGDRERR